MKTKLNFGAAFGLNRKIIVLYNLRVKVNNTNLMNLNFKIQHILK